MGNNIMFESDMSDNERNQIYSIIYNKDDSVKNHEIIIHAKNNDEASRLFMEHVGYTARIIRIEKITRSEYNRGKL